MISLMPPQRANQFPGANYWYEEAGNGGAFPSRPSAGTARRASAAVIQSNEFHSQETNPWQHNGQPLHLDTAQASALALPGQSSSPSANHKAPLAPKQGLAGSIVNSRGQHNSPVSGTYALRTPRGKITSIACESCRKRKSKCDGVRPKCGTCQTKSLVCAYDLAEDGKTTTQLRAHVRRLAKELDDMKSIVPLLATAPDRTSASNWAAELEKNGFARHSVDEIRRALREPGGFQLQLPEQESLIGTPGSEALAQPTTSIADSSYEGFSRDQSREKSQPVSILQLPESAVENAHFGFRPTSELRNFSFDCAFYRRTKRELLANGWDEVQVFGRPDIDVDSVLLGMTDPQDGQPVPTWTAGTVNKLLHGMPLPIRLASTFVFTKMMRWLIWPSVDNMNAMPDWLMPLPRQDCSPYDILIDLIPWPQLRQYLYQHPEEFVLGAFVSLINIEWPCADDACYYWDMEAGCSRLTPLFDNHIRDLNNWTLDMKALEIMPQLEALLPGVIR